MQEYGSNGKFTIGKGHLQLEVDGEKFRAEISGLIFEFIRTIIVGREKNQSWLRCSRNRKRGLKE